MTLSRALALTLALAPLVSSWSIAAHADTPDGPLQTRPAPEDDSWILQGWTANILGISGNGKTLLVVQGDKGFVSSAEYDGQTKQKAHSQIDGQGPWLTTFELDDKDHRVTLKVKEPRGSEWSEAVDVPRGMKVTVELTARYIHRGYTGQIKNDRASCKKNSDRKTLRFEIWAGQEMVGNAITLDPGKSAPGVRLKEGTYELRVAEKRGKEFVQIRTVTLTPTAHLWRHDEPCP